MSRSFKVIEFDEDHCPGQKIIEQYNHTSDYQEFVYVDENGGAHQLFGGSDPMIDALLELLNRNGDITDAREATDEEKELAVNALTVF